MKRLFVGIVVSLALCLSLFATESIAGKVTLAWDPPNESSEVAGYKLYYRMEDHPYTEAIDVGNTTKCIVKKLIHGRTYHFAVTAYNTNGHQSIYSNILILKYKSLGHLPSIVQLLLLD